MTSVLSFDLSGSIPLFRLEVLDQGNEAKLAQIQFICSNNSDTQNLFMIAMKTLGDHCDLHCDSITNERTLGFTARMKPEMKLNGHTLECITGPFYEIQKTQFLRIMTLFTALYHLSRAA